MHMKQRCLSAYAPNQYHRGLCGRVFGRVCVCVCVCFCKNMCLCMYINIHMQLYACVYVCIYIICAYTHTYMQESRKQPLTISLGALGPTRFEWMLKMEQVCVCVLCVCVCVCVCVCRM